MVLHCKIKIVLLDILSEQHLVFGLELGYAENTIAFCLWLHVEDFGRKMNIQLKSPDDR
jgi:hypothetical protein